MITRGKAWLGTVLEFSKPFYFSVKHIEMKKILLSLNLEEALVSSTPTEL